MLSSVGPMARDVDSLALCMQALLCDYMFTLDPTVPPVPFNTQVGPLEGQQDQTRGFGSNCCVLCVVLRRTRRVKKVQDYWLI